MTALAVSPLSVTLTVPPAALWARAGFPLSDTAPPEITHGRAARGRRFGHVYATEELAWDGDSLRLGKAGRLLATIVSDTEWPNLWRVRIGGRRSDMVNRARAKDAALSLALAALNHREAA
jgi:hypothetical protein